MVRRIRQPARALDAGCGVTALSDLRGAALRSGVGLIRRAASHQATGQGVRCRMRRNRLIRPTGGSTSQRRIRQLARALDVGCGVTALSDLRGGSTSHSFSGVGLIRRAASHQATGSGVRCRMRRNRLIRPAGCSTSQRRRPDKTRSVASGNWLGR